MRSRIERRAVRTPLALALALAFVLLVGPSIGAAAPKPPGSGLARILSPGDGGLAPLGGERVVTLRVRTSSRVESFDAHLGPRDVTRRFSAPKHGVRTARLSLGRGLHRGLNHLTVVTAGNGRSDYDYAGFAVAGRSTGLLSLDAESRFSPRRLLRAVSHHGAGIDLFRARLNGHPVSRYFESAKTHRKAKLDVDAGLRYGRNRLVVTVIRDGHFDRERVAFTVRRTHPLVGAGPERTTPAGDRVRIDGSATRPARRSARLRYAWRVVDQPPGSNGAVLRNRHSETPTLIPDVNGHFTLKLSVSRRSKGGAASGRRAARPASTSTSTDTVGVTSQVDAPPLGVPIQTIPLEGGGITYAGQVKVATSEGIQMITIDRGSGHVVGAGQFAYDDDGLNAFQNRLDAIRAPDGINPGEILVLTGAGHSTGTLSADWIATLKRVYKVFGGDLSLFPSASRKYAGLESGEWSLIGVRGMQAGQAAQSWAIQPPGESSEPGGLEGYFRVDQNDNYTFVFAQNSGFNTNLPGQPPNQNQIRVDFPTSFNHWTYTSAPLPDGQSGFHVLVLRQGDLGKIDEQTVATNDAGGAQINDGVTQLANYLGSLQNATYPPLVFIQSIGNPVPASSAWVNSLADAIVALGGTRDVFNAAKEYPGGYTLVGGLDLGGPGAEASQAVTGLPSRLNGMLRPNQQGQWVGDISEPTGGASFLMYEISSQRPTSWPASQTEGQQRAMACITRMWNPPLKDTTDLRANYWKLGFHNSTTNLTVGKLTKATDHCAPRSDFGDASCTAEGTPTGVGGSGDYAAVYCALSFELPLVGAVNAYFLDLQNALLASSFISQTQIGVIGHNIAQAVEPPPVDTTATEALSIISEVMHVVAPFLPAGEGVPEVGGALAASLGLAAELATEPNGNNSLSEEVESSTYALGAAAGEKFDDVYNQMSSVRNLLVGDYGKLTAAGARVASEWDTTKALDAFMRYTQASAKQWFYASLMPVAYDVWDINFDNPHGCYVDYGYQLLPVFDSAADFGWMRYTAGWGAGPVVRTKVLATAGDPGWQNGEAQTPPWQMAQTLFNPHYLDSSGTTNWVGLYPQWFLNEGFTTRPIEEAYPPGCNPPDPNGASGRTPTSPSGGTGQGEPARPAGSRTAASAGASSPRARMPSLR